MIKTDNMWKYRTIKRIGLSLLMCLNFCLFFISAGQSEQYIPSITKAQSLFARIYHTEADSIGEEFTIDIQVFSNASPEPYCTYVFTNCSGRLFRFTISVFLNHGQLRSYTNPIEFEQYKLSMKVEDYTTYFMQEMKQQELIWGNSMWWSYEQKYEFQMRLFGYGSEGYIGDFALPTEQDMTYSDALNVAINEFETLSGEKYDINTVRIIEEFHVNQNVVYTSEYEQEKRRNPCWCFYFTDQTGEFLYCWISINSNGVIESDYCNRMCDDYDIGYMKGIPRIYNTHYMSVGDQ